MSLLAFACKGTPVPEDIQVPVREGGSGEEQPVAEEGSAEAAEEPPLIAAAVRIRQRGVRISEGRTAVVLVGEEEVELLDSRLTAIVLDEERNSLDLPVTWHSLDPEKVTISEDGVLHAVGPVGPAFVTASAGDVIAEQIPVYVVTLEQMPVFEEEEEESGEDTSAPDGSGDRVAEPVAP
jgi:hypothetical protein